MSWGWEGGRGYLQALSTKWGRKFRKKAELL